LMTHYSEAAFLQLSIRNWNASGCTPTIIRQPRWAQQKTLSYLQSSGS
jgi:hypothetical protein